MSGGNSTETPLRESLHNPILGVASTTLADAMTITTSAGGSHFEKLPGKYIQCVRARSICHNQFFPLQRVPMNWPAMPI